MAAIKGIIESNALEGCSTGLSNVIALHIDAFNRVDDFVDSFPSSGLDDAIDAEADALLEFIRMPAETLPDILAKLQYWRHGPAGLATALCDRDVHQFLDSILVRIDV